MWSKIVGVHFAEEGCINHDLAVDGDLKGAVVLLHKEGIALALAIVCSHQRNERLTALNKVSYKLAFIWMKLKWKS
jgi:hypothetical protein